MDYKTYGFKLVNPHILNAGLTSYTKVVQCISMDIKHIVAFKTWSQVRYALLSSAEFMNAKTLQATCMNIIR